MSEQLNTFDGGMNMDLDNDKLATNQYSFAENFRHTVNSDNSLGSLQAINSNKSMNGMTAPGCIRYSVFGQSSVDNLLVLKIKTITNHELDFSLSNSDHSLTTDQLIEIISEKIITTISDAESNIINPMPVGTLLFSIDNNELAIHGGILSYLIYTNLNPNVSCTFKTESDGVSYFIGSTEVRDKTILYGITSKGFDAIMLLSKADSLNDEVISSKCLYIGDLGFNLNYPIIDSAVNYESSVFCKIYFTDNNAPLKHINIFDSNLMAKNESFFDLISNVSLGNIKTSNIYNQSSTHKCGRIQYAFQYYNNNGQESSFSNPSNMIDLTTGNFNGSAADYIGGDINENANKQVEVNIWNMDKSFERFRLVSIFYSGYNSEAIIKIIYEDMIPSSGEFQFIDGNSIGEVITTESLALAGTKLIICKTIDVKNNLLLVANIKDKYEDYSSYDTRAYRFNDIADTAETKLFDTTEITVEFLNLSTTDIPLTQDCKLPKLDQFNYRYGKNKSNDTWMLGGCGDMISYNFVRTPINSGYTYAQVGSGFVDMESLLGQEYPNDNLYLDLTSPIKSGVLSGYMRNEVYRFGIEFYDLKGRKSFVNWIGDIKFPAMSEVDTTYITIDGTNIYDYRTSFTDSIYGIKIIVLGIEFHVDSSKLPPNISGYSIVRMERTKSDKTELAQGLLSGEIQNVVYGSGGPYTIKPSYYIPFSKDGSLAGNGINGTLQYLETSKLKEFISPEISYDVLSNGDLYGKTINIIGEFKNADGTTDLNGVLLDTTSNIIPIQHLYNTKPMHSAFFPNHVLTVDNYESNYESNLSKKINNALIINPSTSQYNTGVTIGSTSFNYGCQIIYGATDMTQTGDVTYKGVSGKCAIIDSDDFNISTIKTNCGLTDGSLIIANISSDDTIQYGGNSYYSRSNNEYISCNHVRSTHAAIGVLSNKIHGGDTYVSKFNHVRIQPRAGYNETKVTTDSTDYRTHYSEFITFVAESTINTNVCNTARIKKRPEYYDCVTYHGTYNVYQQPLNQYGSNMSTTIRSIEKDAYTYNTVFSRNAGSLKFQAKPLNLNENQIFDSRILSSRRKYNGESTDNWLIFDPSEFIDLQNKYGGINKIINFGNNIIALQDEAIGIASVDEKAVVGDTNSPGNIILGTGGILKRYDYISTTSGTKHQASVVKTPTALYYHDSINSKIMMFSGQENPISETKGVQSLLNKYKSLSVDPISQLNISDIRKNVLYSYDQKYREIEMSYILDINATASINDTTKIYKVTVPNSILNLIDISIYWTYDFVIQNKLELFEENKITSINKSGNNYIVTLKNKPTGVLDNDIVTLKFGKTLIFNELAGVFSGFVSRYPLLKFSINKNKYETILNQTGQSLNASHEIFFNDSNYDICNFYRTDYLPRISYVVNQEIDNAKAFDAISLSADIKNLDKNSFMIKNPINKLRCYNTHYNSGWVNGVDYGYTFGNRNEVMVRKFEDKWSIPIPKNSCKYTPDQIIDGGIDILDDSVAINHNRKFREKIDGKYLKVDLVFNTFKTQSIKRISWKLMNIISGFRVRF